MVDQASSSAAYARLVTDERCTVARRKLIDDCPQEWRISVLARLAAYWRDAALQASQRSTPIRIAAPAKTRGNPDVATGALATLRASINPKRTFVIEHS